MQTLLVIVQAPRLLGRDAQRRTHIRSHKPRLTIAALDRPDGRAVEGVSIESNPFSSLSSHCSGVNPMLEGPPKATDPSCAGDAPGIPGAPVCALNGDGGGTYVAKELVYAYGMQARRPSVLPRRAKEVSLISRRPSTSTPRT